METNKKKEKEFLIPLMAEEIQVPKIKKRDTVLTRIDRQINKQIKRLSKIRGIPMSRINDEAISMYLEQKMKIGITNGCVSNTDFIWKTIQNKMEY